MVCFIPWNSEYSVLMGMYPITAFFITLLNGVRVFFEMAAMKMLF